MPPFEGFPYPRRYNTLRLLGYDYNSIYDLCAITIVVSPRRPVFADMKLAKAVLAFSGDLTYIELNPVREGYVSYPFFYPYTGFLPS